MLLINPIFSSADPDPQSPEYGSNTDPDPQHCIGTPQCEPIIKLLKVKHQCFMTCFNFLKTSLVEIDSLIRIQIRVIISDPAMPTA